MSLGNKWNKLINVVYTPQLQNQIFDGLCVIAENVASLKNYATLADLHEPVERYAQLNAGIDNNTVTSIPDYSTQRLIIYSSTGSTNGDFDDVRTFSRAGIAAAQHALKTGLKAPLFVVVPSKRFANAQLVASIGVMHALYAPLIIREAKNGSHKLPTIGIHLPDEASTMVHSMFVDTLNALQAAFQVCRDIGDSDPVRMTPPNVAKYVESYFANAQSVKVSVIDDAEVIHKEYPLTATVNRAADNVEAHRARIIWLDYVNVETPSSTEIDFETLLLIGKGVTIDTGGTDLKTNGVMFGMSQDKYGSAVLAGFFAALEALRPKGIKVRGGMCMVRNSIGSNSYTCDEIIMSRSKKRIHIYNTDAEGRIAMLDPLTQLREQAESEKNPHLITLATLTGHCVLTYGHCSAIIDNGPARQNNYAQKLQATGDLFGQPVEISRLHKEDFDFHSSESEAADLRQANTKPSSATIRGHMSPAAFLIRGSRLDEHGTNSQIPIQFTHIDIGSSMGCYPAKSFPNPLLTLIAHHILRRV